MGDIVRQEAVSMLPPLLLDVQPEHQVLDMCAAPGSKTTQLLEDLARSHATHAAASSSSSAPRGVVVANDCSYDRACLLSHRVRNILRIGCMFWLPIRWLVPSMLTQCYAQIRPASHG